MIATPPARPDGDGVAGDPKQAFGLVVALFLVFAIARGGASADPTSMDLVAFASAPLLGVAVWRSLNMPRAGGWGWPALILLSALAVAALQLVPLPPRIWSSLPGREVVVDGYAAAGVALPWLPISLTPPATWSAARGLLAPAAVFVSVLTLNAWSRKVLAVAVVGVAAVSIGLGMAQLASGGQALRLYPFTDTAAAVGLFANRNHQAVLLVASLPLAACVALRTREGGAPPFFWMAVAFAICVVLVVGVAAAMSRAGILLTAPAALAALAVALRHGRAEQGRGWLSAASVGAATLLAAVLVAVFNVQPLADRFDVGLQDDLRYRLTPAVIDAGAKFAPVGSGLGSFPSIYPMFERPEAVTGVFVNHAHNDYAEIWLEAGWLGLAAVVAFVVWWAVRTRSILAAPDRLGSDLSLSGSVIVGLLLIHSMVDYPLRTPALASVFAFAVGLMTVPPRGRDQAGK